jgi:colicin import membrane protein
MLRKHENKDSWKAGALAIGVHVALLGAMLVSFNWKAAHPVMNVTEVELWDKLPAAKSTPKPEPIVAPKPEIKPEEKPEPKPVEVEKPEPKAQPEEPKVDIELEKKKKELEQKEQELIEKRKNDAAAKKLAQEMREEDLQEKAAEKKQKADLKKLQQEALSEENAEGEKQTNAANASAIGEFTDKIKAKIRGNVNKNLCGDGNPELRFGIGELKGTPKLTKSSGNTACDEAVERAIMASEPLPLPSDASLYAKFRNLNLKFKPNED